jgi:hypothetical protein
VDRVALEEPLRELERFLKGYPIGNSLRPPARHMARNPARLSRE